ncbi:polypeptide N-acetylgalactosaminyltransferase 5-like [Mytilus trossulus]|uniref:polypeptide N-acetylgalactosaminyltransferase 5-like n=1 Tax=Mytilus trossulus TaxID=6551 RepID=UPI00300402A2
MEYHGLLASNAFDYKASSYICVDSDPEYVQGGEMGHGVRINLTLLSPKDKKIYEEGVKKQRMNIYVSDLVSVHRTLDPNMVDPRCKSIMYNENLDPCTVIIPFRDEAWSLLIRTLHSVLDRTPHSILEEIVLVDDGSTEDDLKYKLDLYVSYLPKVRIMRLQKSLGKMAACQKAVDLVKTTHFALLDSHSEVYDGWLQPLLQRLTENPKLFVTPMVGNIYSSTLKYFYHYPKDLYEDFKGMTFDFFLYQQWSPFKKEYIKTLKPTEPIRIPGHQGNAFAVNTNFFMQLGGFDPGMKVWGAIQMELMFKYVMCGGDMESLPCSHVGHVYRSSMKWNKEIHEFKTSNQYRVAEVWMDEYKHLLFERDGNYTFQTGDVSERKKIRERNNCKSFKYFLDHIQEIVHLYIPDNLKASGAIIRPGQKTCLSIYRKIVLDKCYWRGKDQFWEWSADKEIRHGVDCLVPKGKDGVGKENCNFNTVVQWEYRQDNQIQHKDSGLCLTVYNNKKLKLAQCTGSGEQIWIWNRKK